MQCTTIRLTWLAAGRAPKLGDGRQKAASILPLARSVAAVSEAWVNTEWGFEARRILIQRSGITPIESQSVTVCHGTLQPSKAATGA